MARPALAVAPVAASDASGSAPSAAAVTAGGTDATADAAPVKRSWKERIFQRAGKQSAGDFAPNADAIRAKKAPPAPAPVETQAAAVPDTNAEIAALRQELAELRAQSSAPAPAAVAIPEPAAAPVPIDPRAQPFVVAAGRYLGDDAPADLVTRAAEALHMYKAWESNAESADPKLKAEAARNMQAYGQTLDSLRTQAEQARDMAELRARLDRFEAPRLDVAAQKATLFAEERAPVLAKHFPRLAAALTAGTANRAAIEARLDKLDPAQAADAWQDAAVEVLAELDDLFPEPAPAQATTQAQPAARPGPANPAASIPRESGGTTGARPPPANRLESRARLKDRWMQHTDQNGKSAHNRN